MIFPAGLVTWLVPSGWAVKVQPSWWHHVVVPAVILEICQAGVPAVLAVHHVMRLAAGGLVAAAGVLPLSTQEAERALWMTC